MSNQAAVLVVDDEPAVGRYIAATLSRSGYKATLAEDAGQALSCYRTSPAGFDLVLTDIVMAGMNGPELIRELRSREPNLRVLYMSGYKGAHLERYSAELQGCEVLSKPFTPAELLDAVTRTISGSQVLKAASGPRSH